MSRLTACAGGVPSVSIVASATVVVRAGFPYQRYVPTVNGVWTVVGATVAVYARHLYQSFVATVRGAKIVACATPARAA